MSPADIVTADFMIVVIWIGWLFKIIVVCLFLGAIGVFVVIAAEANSDLTNYHGPGRPKPSDLPSTAGGNSTR